MDTYRPLRAKKDFLFGGRLARYKYYDMHQVLSTAQAVSRKGLGRTPSVIRRRTCRQPLLEHAHGGAALSRVRFERADVETGARRACVAGKILVDGRIRRSRIDGLTTRR